MHIQLNINAKVETLVSHYANKGREHSTKVIEELHELDYRQKV